jgi:hypothetical protein
VNSYCAADGRFGQWSLETQRRNASFPKILRRRKYMGDANANVQTTELLIPLLLNRKREGQYLMIVRGTRRRTIYTLKWCLSAQ